MLIRTELMLPTKVKMMIVSIAMFNTFLSYPIRKQFYFTWFPF